MKVFVVVMSAPASKVGVVDLGDDLGLGEVQQVGVALDVARVVARTARRGTPPRSGPRPCSSTPQAPSSTAIRSLEEAVQAGARVHAINPSGRPCVATSERCSPRMPRPG